MAAIIFDMDGTIADSFDYVADFMASESGVGPLSDEQKKSLRGLSMVGMARQLGYQWWQGPMLLFRGRRRMHAAIRELRSFAGMPELIRKVHAEGHQLFVLSTNSLSNVRLFLHRQKIHKYFLEIYGGVGVFNKAPALRELLREQNLDVKQAVYVGDEQRDVAAAKQIGMRAIAVSWGFADRGNLKAMRPAALADTPEELMRILEEL